MYVKETHHRQKEVFLSAVSSAYTEEPVEAIVEVAARSTLDQNGHFQPAAEL